MVRWAALRVAAALLMAGGTTAAGAWAQNAEANKNAPPRHFTLGPVATPGVIVAEVWEGKVTSVVDGSTLLVERGNRKAGSRGDKSASVVVRLWGVTVPGDASAKAAAKAFVEKSVMGKWVRIQAQTRAKNGDLLADVFLLPDDKPRYGGSQDQMRDLNHPTASLQPRPLTEPTAPVVFPNLTEGLIRAGLALWDKAGTGQTDNLSKAQADAQKNKVGLWASGGNGTK